MSEQYVGYAVQATKDLVFSHLFGIPIQSRGTEFEIVLLNLVVVNRGENMVVVDERFDPESGINLKIDSEKFASRVPDRYRHYLEDMWINHHEFCLPSRFPVPSPTINGMIFAKHKYVCLVVVRRGAWEISGTELARMVYIDTGIDTKWFCAGVTDQAIAYHFFVSNSASDDEIMEMRNVFKNIVEYRDEILGSDNGAMISMRSADLCYTTEFPAWGFVDTIRIGRDIYDQNQELIATRGEIIPLGSARYKHIMALLNYLLTDDERKSVIFDGLWKPIDKS